MVTVIYKISSPPLPHTQLKSDFSFMPNFVNYVAAIVLGIDFWFFVLNASPEGCLLWLREQQRKGEREGKREGVKCCNVAHN